MGNPKDLVAKHDFVENTMTFNYINQTGPYRLLASPTSVIMCLSWLQVRDLAVYMMGLLSFAFRLLHGCQTGQPDLVFELIGVDGSIQNVCFPKIRMAHWRALS